MCLHFIQVTWIRRSDLKILTIGEILYTQDKRFSPIHNEGSNVWMLKLTNPQLKDSGEYECQVSYHDDKEEKLRMPYRLIVLGKNDENIDIYFGKICSFLLVSIFNYVLRFVVLNEPNFHFVIYQKQYIIKIEMVKDYNTGHWSSQQSLNSINKKSHGRRREFLRHVRFSKS